MSHGIAPLHHAVEALAAGAGPLGALLLPLAADAAFGLLAGAAVLTASRSVSRLRP